MEVSKQLNDFTIFSSSHMVRAKKPHRYSEFVNYKPLLESDTPIEALDEDSPKKQNIRFNSENFQENTKPLNTLLVDHDHIDSLLKDWVRYSMDSIKENIFGSINIVSRKAKQIFIDLDDTLIFTSKMQLSPNDTEKVNGNFINIRPFANELLRKLYKYYDIIVSKLFRYIRAPSALMYIAL